MRLVLATLLILAGVACAEPVQPFGVEAVIERSDAASILLTVTLRVPPRHHLFADQMSLLLGGGTMVPAAVSTPVAIRVKDSFSDADRDVLAQDAVYTYRLPDPGTGVVSITVGFQGCSESQCLFPATEVLSGRFAGLSMTGSVALTRGAPTPLLSATPTALAIEAYRPSTNAFRIVASISGYASAGEFIAFLQAARKGEVRQDLIAKAWNGGAIGWALILILLGGLALNLTPCVLPMIPINVAIIGAGARAGSRWRGLFRGGMYGAGIAMAYGTLGLVVVLSGSKFGALNASPWFNIALAVLFTIMALAMFDVFMIDFTRFQGRVMVGGQGAGVAFVLGAISAVLAGACVAPVLISVLVLSGSLFAAGNRAGLLLPFVLGVGMALPWPLAGAGLSFLPKPGKWMERVKYAFGVFILAMAVYYGYTGFQAWHARQAEGTHISTAAGDQWLTTALDRAQAEGRPILIDFWAGWCKNCEAMEATTFQDPAVRRELGGFIVVKYRAEAPNDSPAREVLDRFGVLGLPTYVVLRTSEVRGQ